MNIFTETLIKFIKGSLAMMYPTDIIKPKDKYTKTNMLLLGFDLVVGTETSSITEKIGVSLFNFILLLLYSAAKFMRIFCCN